MEILLAEGFEHCNSSLEFSATPFDLIDSEDGSWVAGSRSGSTLYYTSRRPKRPSINVLSNTDTNILGHAGNKSVNLANAQSIVTKEELALEPNSFYHILFHRGGAGFASFEALFKNSTASTSPVSSLFISGGGSNPYAGAWSHHEIVLKTNALGLVYEYDSHVALYSGSTKSHYNYSFKTTVVSPARQIFKFVWSRGYATPTLLDNIVIARTEDGKRIKPVFITPAVSQEVEASSNAAITSNVLSAWTEYVRPTGQTTPVVSMPSGEEATIKAQYDLSTSASILGLYVRSNVEAQPYAPVTIQSQLSADTVEAEVGFKDFYTTFIDNKAGAKIKAADLNTLTPLVKFSAGSTPVNEQYFFFERTDQSFSWVVPNNVYSVNLIGVSSGGFASESISRGGGSTSFPYGPFATLAGGASGSRFVLQLDVLPGDTLTFKHTTTILVWKNDTLIALGASSIVSGGLYRNPHTYAPVSPFHNLFHSGVIASNRSAAFTTSGTPSFNTGWSLTSMMLATGGGVPLEDPVVASTDTVVIDGLPAVNARRDKYGGGNVGIMYNSPNKAVYGGDTWEVYDNYRLNGGLRLSWEEFSGEGVLATTLGFQDWRSASDSPAKFLAVAYIEAYNGAARLPDSVLTFVSSEHFDDFPVSEINSPSLSRYWASVGRSDSATTPPSPRVTIAVSSSIKFTLLRIGFVSVYTSRLITSTSAAGNTTVITPGTLQTQSTTKGSVCWISVNVIP